MQLVPRILCARSFASLPDPSKAPLMVCYFEDNRAHLAPWEPEREPGYHGLAAWQRRLRQWHADWMAGTALHLAIFTPAGDEVVGLCSLTNIVRGPFQACRMGYSIASRYEGRGLMTETVGAIVSYAFTELGLHRVMANYMPANVRSARLLERLGFEREGLARQYLKIAGRWEDHVLTARVAPH